MQRNAWRLNLENQTALIIAQTQVMEYLGKVDTIHVPDCNSRCGQVALWRNLIVPVLGATDTDQQSHEHLLIVVFKDTREQRPAFMALSLCTPPTAIIVNDKDQCPPSESLATQWGKALCCCIENDNEILPIVDFSHLD